MAFSRAVRGPWMTEASGAEALSSVELMGQTDESEALVKTLARMIEE
jgi:hypothetical protein